MIEAMYEMNIFTLLLWTFMFFKLQKYLLSHQESIPYLLELLTLLFPLIWTSNSTLLHFNFLAPAVCAIFHE